MFLRRRPASSAEQDVLEQSFFKSLALPNGTHKTTAAGRLGDVDEVICEYTAGKRRLTLMDVGISSGVTTLELLERLDRAGTAVRAVGVDLCTRAYLASLFGVDVLYDRTGHILQIATPLFARGRPAPALRSLQSRLLRLGFAVLQRRLFRRKAVGSGRERPLDLVCPRLTRRKDFSLIEHDILLPRPEWDNAYDLIRVANVLNADYFPESQISQMIANLAGWLKPEGLLVIVRTHAADGCNRGTVYAKTPESGRLRPIREFGGGYDLREAVAGAAKGLAEAGRPAAE